MNSHDYAFDDPGWYARRDDPVTSQLAVQQMDKAAISLAICDEMVHQLRLHGPMIDEEIEHRLRATHVGQWVTPSGLRTRRCRLVRQGVLVDTGRKGQTAYGRLAILWGLAEQAHAYDAPHQ